MEVGMGEVAEIEKSRPHRVRVQHDRSRLVHALEGLGRALGGNLDVPTLAMVASLNEDEYQAIVAMLIERMTEGVGAIGKSKIPTIDAQLENFRTWQLAHSEYFQWPQTAMDALRAKLETLGPEAELVPLYALSVGVRLSNGQIILLDREGRECRG
jgi:hypothetical protein